MVTQNMLRTCAVFKYKNIKNKYKFATAVYLKIQPYTALCSFIQPYTASTSDTLHTDGRSDTVDHRNSCAV